jgi:hypothetical protein
MEITQIKCYIYYYDKFGNKVTQSYRGTDRDIREIKIHWAEKAQLEDLGDVYVSEQITYKLDYYNEE